MRRGALAVGLVVLVLAVGSLALIEVGNRALTRDLHITVSSLDQLARIRLHMGRAYLAADRLDAGDPTFSTTLIRSELASAMVAVDDARRGRSALLGIDSIRFVTESRHEALDRVSQRISEFGEVASVSEVPNPIGMRVAWAALEAELQALEFEVYEEVAIRIAESEARHTRTLLAWFAFFGLGGGVSLLLYLAHARAIASKGVAERERDQVSADYSSIQLHSQVGLLRVDGAGGVREANLWWLDRVGLSHAGPSGSGWWLALGEEAPRMEDLWSRRCRRGEPFSVEFYLDRGVGEGSWILAHWSPLEDGEEGGREVETGLPKGWLGTLVDISDSHRIQGQLQQMQKVEAIGELTSGIAHDFNNLLTIILSSVELLRGEDGVSHPDREEIVEEIATAATGGTELIRRMMGFARKGEIRIERIELGPLIQSTAQLGRRLLPDTIHLELTLPQEHIWVHADAHGLQQVVLNLLSNARDAIEPPGTIRVEVDRVEVDDDFVDDHPWFRPGRFGRVSVTDTGCGMNEETLGRVFDPFFTTKAEGRGTGLGLSTVQNLVRQLAGHVHVYSEVGQGSVFRVYIPEVSEAPAGWAGQPPRGAAVSPAGMGAEVVAAELRGGGASQKGPMDSGVILVVDDEASLLRSASRILTRLGYSVQTAESAEAALQRVLGHSEGEEISIVLSDVSLGGMTGVELRDRLRASGWGGGFVFMSGYSPRELHTDGAYQETLHFLPKPWSVPELVEVLARAQAGPPPTSLPSG